MGFAFPLAMGLYIALLKHSSVFAEAAAKKTISARSGDGKSRRHLKERMIKEMKRILSLLIAMVMTLGCVGITAMAEGSNVAKVGNTEYATIDEAIAAWTNGTTLTLLADVTLSDVITIKSTEHHILNLGTYTMTAASNKNAFVIQACGNGSAERSTITINADATNPGGINAGTKCVVYYKYADGGISTEDRPIININGGIFTGSTSSFGTAGIYTIGTAARKCATLNISGGTFNCSINGSGKSKLIISGGTFNYSVGSQGDSTANRLISGGTFKTFGFMTADSNNTKFWFGTSMNNSNVGVYVDDNGYIVVGGDPIIEAGETFEASSANYSGASSLLQYSSAKNNGLYYTSVEEAFADNNKTTGSVTVYVEELDMTDINYKGTIVVPEGKEIKIIVEKDTTPTWSVTNDASVTYTDADGNVLEKDESGAFVESAPAEKTVATVDGVSYTDIQEAIKAAAPDRTVELLADVTVDTWYMMTEKTIASNQLITLVIDGLVIKGNDNTLTINSVESASNGGYLFDDARNLSIQDLTIEYPNNGGGIGLKSGTISNVTINGGNGIYPGANGVTISGCTFKTNGDAIYYENENEGIVITGNTFEIPSTENVVILRSNEQFTDNTIVSGRTVNIAQTSSATVRGNDFGNVRFKVYNEATATIENNTINNLVFDNETPTQSTFTANMLSADAQAALDAVTAKAVAKIGTTEYTDFAAAMTDANAMAGDVTVEIYDKVTLNTSLAGNYDSIKFVGMTDNAEIYMEIDGYIEASSKNVSFADLKLSKSAGPFVNNAGFMNVAFGVYSANTVTYTNCTFANGAYASSGTNTFTGCTFYRSHDKYGLWAYGNVDVVVEGCTFADYRGIKMYAEGAAKTVDLTVTNTNFSAVTDKPAIVLTYGENVTLEKNTYSSTGVFELDLDGAPNGTPVTSDVAPTCKNDNGVCGVLVDGKIYTTVAQAAEVATEGSKVTLLHNSTETVEFAEGVILDKNGFEAAGVTVKVSAVAEVNGVQYATLEEAFAAAKSGDEILLLADVEGDITIPANVIFNGNGFAVSGGIIADGNITFAGITKAKDFDVKYTGTTINIGSGATLELTGTDRMVIGHDCTFNITGTITDAKTANVADLAPSLIVAAGASFTGTNLTFNVTNAYIKFNSNSTSKNKNANGTFNFNITNSIWEQTGVLGFYVPTEGMDPTFNLALKDSVLTSTSHLVFSVSKGEIVIDNSNVNNGVYRQLENQSTLTIKNGSVVYATVATSSNAKNPGTTIVDNATYTTTGEFSGSDLGTGTLIVKNGAKFSTGKITKANITIDAAGLSAGEVDMIAADLSKFEGTVSVVNNNLEAKIENGKIVLVTKPVAKIGDTTYTDFAEALAAVADGDTLTLLDNVSIDYDWNRRSHIPASITIDGGEHTITFNCSVNDGFNYYSAFHFTKEATVKNLTVDMTNATGWGMKIRAISTTSNLTVDNCTFIGNGSENNTRAIIFGEGAGNNIGNLVISITNSNFNNWRRGVSDNESRQDVKSLTLTGNTFNDADVAVSALETVTFTGNTVTDGYVDIRSYTEGNTLDVTATGNTLKENTETKYNYIKAGGTVNAQEGFVLPWDGVTISNLDELKMFRDAVNAGNNYAGKTVTLTADIDLAGENWTPIGAIYNEHGFMGNFDGQNHKIMNLTITDPDLDSDGYAYAGLFGITEGIDEDNQNFIKDLTIENVTINTTGHIVAAAIAYPYYTIVDNVKVCGKISISGGDYTAGVLAYTRRCINASNLFVEGDTGSTISGRQVVGGVISDIQMNGGLTADYSNFNVSGVVISGTKNVGGISGIICEQKLIGGSVKDVTLSCDDARVGIVSGSLGGASVISNVTIENVTGASSIVGADYATGKVIEAKIGDKYYKTLAEALTDAKDGDTVTLIWKEGDAPIAINGAVFGKSVTITGDATVDWSKGFLFVGRGGEGNGTVTFDKANLKSASNSSSYGIHVSGREKNTNNKYDGTVIIKDSTIELDYLINKGTMTLDNSTLTVKNGFSVGGRPASETESGEDVTATLNLNNNSKVIVNNHNGMGLGYEALGVVNIESGSTFEYTQNFLITAKGTMNVKDGSVIGNNVTLTNNGTINLTGVNATITAQEGLEVNSTVDGYEVVYAEGKYNLKAIEEVKLFDFYGSNVVLGNSLSMDFYVADANLDGTDYYAEIKHYAEDKVITTEIPYSDWEVASTGYHKFSYSNLAAKQIADKLEVTILTNAGKKVSITREDGLRAYAFRAYDKYADKEDADLKLLTAVTDMLNYGAAAQQEFGYNLNNLANAGTEVYQKYATATTPELEDIRVKDDKVYGTNVTLEENIILSGYFADVTSDMYAMITFTDHYGNPREIKVDYTEFKPNGSYYQIDVDELAIADAAVPVTITVYNADDTKHSEVVESVNSYLCRAMKAYPSKTIFAEIAEFAASAFATLHNN